MSLSIEFNEDLTQQWWERLLKDKTQMDAWLAKLWSTEKKGYHGGMSMAQKYTKAGSKERAIFYRIAHEELLHSQLLLDVLEGRGIDPDTSEQPNSVYWPHVMKGINDLQSAAAASAIGEMLAARRFDILQKHPETPRDVMHYLNQALPDETRHCLQYQEIAGTIALGKALQRHNEAVVLMQQSRRPR